MLAAGATKSLASLAVIGPGGGQTIATNSGGEAAGGLLDQQVSALTTLRNDTKGQGAQINYAVADDLTGSPVPASALSHDGKAGLLRTNNSTHTTQVDAQLNFYHQRPQRAASRRQRYLDRNLGRAHGW